MVFERGNFWLAWNHYSYIRSSVNRDFTIFYPVGLKNSSRLPRDVKSDMPENSRKRFLDNLFRNHVKGGGRLILGPCSADEDELEQELSEFGFTLSGYCDKIVPETSQAPTGSCWVLRQRPIAGGCSGLQYPLHRQDDTFGGVSPEDILSEKRKRNDSQYCFRQPHTPATLFPDRHRQQVRFHGVVAPPHSSTQMLYLI